MKTTRLITLLVAAAMALTSMSALAQGGGKGGANAQQAQQRAQVERGQRDLDRDRMRDRDRIEVPAQDRDRIQDRTHAPEHAGLNENQIYGYELMTEPERKAYRERIMNAENRQEREQIEAQHRHEMQVRAKNRDIEIDDAGKPIEE